MKRVVTIGGGTGQYTLLSGLKEIADLEITAVVTMADSGGSSGVLRTERGALPPGDALRCLLALATVEEDVIQLFEHRFAGNGGVGGHRIGNIALTGAAELHGGDFLEGLTTLGRMLHPHGRVLPVTIDHVQLHAELHDGTIICGEHGIDRRGADGHGMIHRVWLEPEACAFPPTVDAILGADAVIIGPGDLYTSIVPNLLVGGIASALQKMRGPLVFILNAMTKRGETDGFTAEDFVHVFEQYAQRPVDIVLGNSRPPAEDIIAKYHEEGATWVPAPRCTVWDGRTIVAFPLLGQSAFARHDPVKLAHVVRALVP
ncbi:YvcK family protein [Candidatus Uhrbacteria bacterium]|nr:YvcK family protein [Candidatus Uhrbacteria bacterium]